MRILVTGANGYLGQGIVKAILNRKNEVVATDFNLNNVDEKAEKEEQAARPGNAYPPPEPASTRK